MGALNTNTKAGALAAPAFRIVWFPSADGNAHDLFGLVPGTMSVEHASFFAEAVIDAANEEDGNSEDGLCADGLCVEESIRRRLTEHGFIFPEAGQILRTSYWDNYRA